MGALSDALSQPERPSAYAAKKTDIWAEIQAIIDFCVLPDDIARAREQIEGLSSQFPEHWWSSIDDQLEVQAELIRQDDIGRIMRDKFDF
jgi:mevalonate pyrophosphate decarboxylase